MPRLLVIALVSALAVSACATAAVPDDTDPRWLDRLSREDRAALELVVGTPPAAFPSDVRWHEGRALAWDELRGQVILVQSWTSRTAAGRAATKRLESLLTKLPSRDGLVVIALHTPDGAERAAEFLERRSVRARIVIDPAGTFCDELGVYRRPVNLLVDRQGIVRHAGLNERGTAAALAALLAEPFDADAAPPGAAPAPESVDSAVASAEYPSISGSVGSAMDIRGKRAPDFFVQQWMTASPAMEGKVVIVDFWATWCGPCVASIPHMNEMAERFDGSVAIVGVSSEANGAFANGMRKLEQTRGISLDTFRYAIALDSTRRMQNAVKVRGIPHVLVMSPDWVVRWQGHPARLTADTIEAIVRAAGAGENGGSERAHPRPPRRWQEG